MSNETPEEKPVHRLIRFDFPPGAGPEEIARAIREAGYRLLAEKKKAEEEKKPDDPR